MRLPPAHAIVASGPPEPSNQPGSEPTNEPHSPEFRAEPPAAPSNIAIPPDVKSVSPPPPADPPAATPWPVNHLLAGTPDLTTEQSLPRVLPTQAQPKAVRANPSDACADRTMPGPDLPAPCHWWPFRPLPTAPSRWGNKPAQRSPLPNRTRSPQSSSAYTHPLGGNEASRRRRATSGKRWTEPVQTMSSRFPCRRNPPPQLSLPRPRNPPPPTPPSPPPASAPPGLPSPPPSVASGEDSFGTLALAADSLVSGGFAVRDDTGALLFGTARSGDRTADNGRFDDPNPRLLSAPTADGDATATGQLESAPASIADLRNVTQAPSAPRASGFRPVEASVPEDAGMAFPTDLWPRIPRRRRLERRRWLAGGAGSRPGRQPWPTTGDRQAGRASAPEDDQYRRARPPGEDLITADEIDLEDLTKHLYERVRRSLRAETSLLSVAASDSSRTSGDHYSPNPIQHPVPKGESCRPRTRNNLALPSASR